MEIQDFPLTGGGCVYLLGLHGTVAAATMADFALAAALWNQGTAETPQQAPEGPKTATVDPKVGLKKKAAPKRGRKAQGPDQPSMFGGNES